MDEPELQALINEGTHHRGWISNSYAQVEFLLGDLIARSRVFPQYEQHNATVSHSATRRAAKVRAMLQIEGPLSPFADELTAILDAFEQTHDVRNLLAHGFCQFYYTPDGDAGFVFRKFDRDAAAAANDDAACVQRTFRLIDLEYHRVQSIALADHALEFFMDLHQTLGWSG